MSLFEKMSVDEHEQVVYCYDKASGLKSIIAIHNTTLGPALGGVRIWPYKDEEEALFDVIRLSRGMTYKSSAAGINFGGGKAVIIAHPSDKSEALLRTFGRFVETLGGRYITAEDVNTSTDDIMTIREETKHVAGLPESIGGAGNPSPFTALGVFEGIKISVKRKLGLKSLKGIKVAVQGVGSVGEVLCKLLHKKGATLIVSDISEEKVRRIKEKYHALTVETDKIYSVEAEVFAPCALGAIINDQSIPDFKFSVVAGAANNQLLDEEKHGNALKKKNILYAPDYIINAGGVINCNYELINEYNRDLANAKVKKIYETLDKIFRLAEKDDLSPHVAAGHYAKSRIEILAQVKRINLGS